MVQSVIKAIEAIKEEIVTNKLYLTNLDADIGDGDHGLNLARGFEAVANKLHANEPKDLLSVFKTVGMTLLSTVGGASGVLYGSAFIKMAPVVKEVESITPEIAAKMLRAGLESIKEKGKATRGEKTMVDALEPACEAMEEAASLGQDLVSCLKSAYEAAAVGVEETKPIIATKGRASYLGERSIGHQDPGATSSMIILKTLYDYMQTK